MARLVGGRNMRLIMSFGAKLELGLRVKLKLRKGKLHNIVMLGNRKIGVAGCHCLEEIRGWSRPGAETEFLSPELCEGASGAGVDGGGRRLQRGQGEVGKARKGVYQERVLTKGVGHHGNSIQESWNWILHGTQKLKWAINLSNILIWLS